MLSSFVRACLSNMSSWCKNGGPPGRQISSEIIAPQSQHWGEWCLKMRPENRTKAQTGPLLLMWNESRQSDYPYKIKIG